MRESEEYEQALSEIKTELQRRFVEYYISAQKPNGTQAVKDAGYKVSNDNSAAATAARLLRMVKIKAAIDAGHRFMMRKVRMDRDGILEQYRQLVETRVTDVLSFGTRERKVTKEDGSSYDEAVSYVNIKNSDELPSNITAAITEVAETADGIRVKMADRSHALDAMAKILGLTKENTTIILAALEGQAESQAAMVAEWIDKEFASDPTRAAGLKRSLADTLDKAVAGSDE
jgi:phage terminase small subunit